MLKCKICGYKSSSTNLMHSHISSAHRSTVIRDSRLDRSDECTMFSSATLAAFITQDAYVPSENRESFSEGGGSFGGGGSSGSWDSSDSGSSSSDCGSSSDSGCSGD